MTAQARSAALVRPTKGLHWSLFGAAAGFAYAVLGLLASEPLAWWPFALLAPVPLMAIVLFAAKAGRRVIWRTAAGAWVGSLPLWIITHAWMFKVSPVGFFPGMLLQGAWAGVFVLLAAIAVRGRGGPVLTACLLAIAWSFVEVFRGSVLFGGYAWLLAGHPLIDAPIISASGAWVGAYGVSFAVALVAAALTLLLGSRDDLTRMATLAIAPLAILLGLGFVAPKPGQPSGARVAIVQTNVPQDNRMAWSMEDQVALFDEFAAMTLSARGNADVVVWPETMLPGPAISPQALIEMRRFGLVFVVDLPDRDQIEATYFADEALELHGALGVPMIVGATGMDGLRLSTGPDGSIVQEYDALYNSAHLFVNGGLEAARYDKLKLTIFGEVLPLVSRWDWLEEKLLLIGAGGMRFDLDAGEKPVWFDVPIEGRGPLRVGTPICFEVAYAGVSRRLARGNGDRVDALVNLTNDGWFSTSDAGRAMHLKLARWRALENGVPIVRAANTGISTIIDARGGIAPTEATMPEGPGNHAVSTAGTTFATRTPQVVMGEVPGRTVRSTPYSAVGFLTPWLLFAAGLLVLLRGLASGRRPG
ncbi:MAG: apolipoprotein N-acyltransferase [Phycisphaerales bacterium]